MARHGGGHRSGGGHHHSSSHRSGGHRSSGGHHSSHNHGSSGHHHKRSYGTNSYRPGMYMSRYYNYNVENAQLDFNGNPMPRPNFIMSIISEIFYGFFWLLPKIFQVALIVVIGIIVCVKIGEKEGYEMFESLNSYFSDSDDDYSSYSSSDTSYINYTYIDRDKIESGYDYIEDCVIDEIGILSNIDDVANSTSYLWSSMGVQSYVIIKSWDESISTDSARVDWTSDYYDENFEREDIFLLVIWTGDETNTDIDYATYALGYDTETVFDDEVMDLFWEYYDFYIEL